MELESEFEKIRLPILILFLFLVTLSVYAPSLNGRLFFDDEYLIVRNSYVQDFSIVKIFTSQLYAGAGQTGSFYRPLQPFFHSLIYQFFKTNPFPHHLFSILLHFGSVVLLLFLLMDFKISKLIAFFSALLFVVHPLSTQPVSYISCLGDPLGLFFLLSAFLIYRKRNFFKKEYYFYLLFFTCILLSLFAKERSVLFLLAFILMEISFPKEGISFKNSFKENKSFYLGLLLLTIFYFIIILLAWSSFKSDSILDENGLNLFTKFCTFLHAFFEYMGLLFFPFGLYSERPFVSFNTLLDWKILFALGILVALAYFSILKFKSQKVLFFSFFWFILFLIPSSGIVFLGYTVKEHWLYYSLIGFCFGFSYYFFKLIKNKKIAISLFLIICLVLSIVAFSRNVEWSNPKLFFRNELVHNPNSENAIANLAYEYYLKNDIDSAVLLYQKGINVTKSNQLAMMYYNLGYMYSLKGEINRSIPLYNRALEIDPNYLYALQELSKYYSSTNDTPNFNKYSSRLLLVQNSLGI